MSERSPAQYEACIAEYRRWNEQEHAEVEALRARVHELEAALIGLAHEMPDPSAPYCFCEMAIGNPMVRGHSGACADAVAALRILQDD